ncbi:hypothetical protein A7982_12576 [Minicystis rosea]|nr:hypothetical protein A7982_12576 [Minicystis rosea]
MITDRAAITRTIKVYHDVIADTCLHTPGLSSWLRDDAESLGALLDRACAIVGLPRAEYDAALREDLSLRELQRLALDDVLLEQGDPGPNAEISRESPAGTPENYHINDWAVAGGTGGPRPRR